MGKINLGLPSNNSNKVLKNSFEQWRNYQKNTSQNYLLLPVEFKEYLPHIRSSAINLYLYYFYKAKNNTGESWPAVSTVAEYFGVTTKTINNWNKELVDLSLIARVDERRSSTSTYILPISDFYYIERTLTASEFLEKRNEKKVGKLKGIFDFFQWRKSKDDDLYNVPSNIICLLFEYSGTSADNEHFSSIMGVLFPNRENTNYKISYNSEEFKVDTYQFDSPVLKNYQDGSVVKKGIAIKSTLNLLKLDDPHITEFLRELNDHLEILDQLNSVSVEELK